ncbi:MAG: PHP domain-containing protein [Bdellovibrionota bacterium]
MKTRKRFLGDFHVHSNLSDGRLPIHEVIDLYGKLGFGVIAITDHIAESHTFVGKAAVYLNQVLTPETFPKYMETLKEEGERAWKQYGMLVIPGFELSKNSVSNHRSAHILGIGVTEYVEADGDPIELAAAIHKQGALAVAAHPVNTRKFEKQTYHLWDRREELANTFDAWEVASGPYLFDEVLATSLPKIASSDLHKPAQMTSYKTVLECERHPEAILDAIRRQQISFEFYRAPVPKTAVERPVQSRPVPSLSLLVNLRFD